MRKAMVVCLLILILAIPVNAGTKLTKSGGVNYFGNQKETWYNLPMDRVYKIADSNFGSHHKRWTRKDGVKMYGTYIIIAAPYDVHPYGTNVETSLGTGIVLDTGAFAETNKNQIDIAVDW